MLLIFGGLPGTGKTTLARRIARQLAAVYLRIDTLEQAIIHSSMVTRTNIGPAGYMVGYAAALDNLCLGLHVVADSVNPVQITRDAWREVAMTAEVPYLEVELQCTDTQEHQKRIESRKSDIAGLILPDWHAVQNREYELWCIVGI